MMKMDKEISRDAYRTDEVDLTLARLCRETIEVQAKMDADRKFKKEMTTKVF